MEKLIEKYRPQSFSEVRGQDGDIARLRELSRQRAQQHYLFAGPSGTGKTSLALMTARAYHCEGDRQGDLPCGKCTSCHSYREGRPFNYQEHSGSRLSAETLEDVLRFVGFGGVTGKKVYFIDETQGLHTRLEDKLLTVLETARSSIFMFATDRPDGLSKRFTDRLTKVRLNPLDRPTSYSYLKDVCGQEGFDHDGDALELIAEVSGGSARALLENLEEVSSSGDRISASAVRATLKLDRLRNYVPCLTALLEGDLAASVGAVNDMLEPPLAKASAVRALVTQVYENVVLGIWRPGLGIGGISVEQRHAIVDALRRRADEKGWSVDQLFARLVAGFEPRTSDVDSSWLMARMIGTHALLCDIPPKEQKVRRPLHAGRALRTRVSDDAPHKRNYLPKEKVASILDAASNLAQVHGKLLNCRLVFFHDRIPFDQSEGSDLVAKCVHELGMRVKSWTRGKDAFHYLYLHQLSGKLGFNTTVVGAIPEDYTYDVAEWLDGFHRRWVPRPQKPKPVRLTFNRLTTRDAEVRLHWRLQKQLCRNLDPNVKVEFQGEARSVADLLQIAQRIREPLGDIVLAHPIRTSTSLSPKTIRASGLPSLSAFRDGAWEHMQTGWELDEYSDRQREVHQLEARIGRVEADLEEGPARQLELDRLCQSVAQDAHLRERTWRKWRKP